jgi:hypothetical protein
MKSTAKKKLAEDRTLTKVLFYDTLQQTRCPAGIAAVNADNCYNRTAHLIVSMAFQSVGVPTTATVSMLSTIQDIKFFLRTEYGNSTAFGGATGEIKMQGLCQGNGTALACWLITYIMMIRAHKRKDHGVHFVNLITKDNLHVIGTI